MAIPPQNQLGAKRTLGSYSSSGGYSVNIGATNLSKSNSPVLNPPILLGSDSAQVNLTNNPSNLLTFTNLVNRARGINPFSNLTSQSKILTIPAGSTLQFILSGLNATPVVTTISGIQITQSILGPGQYKIFQAQVNPSVPSGTVYAQLYYQS